MEIAAAWNGCTTYRSDRLKDCLSGLAEWLGEETDEEVDAVGRGGANTRRLPELKEISAGGKTLSTKSRI